jgi:carbonic anhydrase
MKPTLLTLALCFYAATAYAADGPHWGYGGAEGPEHWGELDPAFKLCSSGKNQSPVDLKGFVEADLKPIQFTYRAGAGTILNNGHTIQVNYAPGSTITVNGHRFELKQFHFHAPSENLIEGKSYPFEGHWVHADDQGNLAVVAVMFREGAANPLLAKLWREMPEKVGEKRELAEKLDVSALLPKNRDYYRFNGSLTTPPCSEGVWWLVMKKPMTVSKEQVEQFAHAMRHPNNRPVQSLNARPVLQ